MPLARSTLGPGALRLLLALVVLASHLSALNIGRPAVVLFFVVSGYWVSRRWLEGGAGVMGFALARLLRIWPLFALISVLTWLGQGWLGLPREADLAAGLLLLGSASRGDLLIGVAWSLDLELQFYLCLPLLWLAARRLPGWQLWLLGGLAWGLGMWLMARGAWSFLLYLPAFAAGMWLAVAKWCPTVATLCRAAAAFVAIAAGMAIYPEMRPLLLKSPGLSPLVEQLGHLVWALLLLPLVARVLAGPSGARDRQLGDAAYALYLVHSPIITLLAAGLALDGLALKLGALPATALATLFAWRCIDVPLERARRGGEPIVIPGFAPLNWARKRPN